MRRFRNLFATIRPTIIIGIFSTVVIACMLIARPQTVQADPPATEVKAQVAYPVTWSRFRGPNGTGYGTAANLPDTWTKDDYLWTADQPGKGHSSPVVWRQWLVTTSGLEEDGTRIVICLNSMTGEKIWEKRFASTTHEKHQNNSYASPSPVLDGRNVYTTMATPEQYTVVALDMKSGDEIWRHELGPFNSEHGLGISPIVYGDLLIVPKENLGRENQPGDSFIVALDRATGKIRWKTERFNDFKTPYGTPCVRRTREGKEELIFASEAHGIYALDPATGKEIWSHSQFNFRTVYSPQLTQRDRVIAGSGSGGGGKTTILVRPPQQRDNKGIVTVEREFTARAPYTPTPVVLGDLLFFWADSGIAACHDLSRPADEETEVWLKRIGGRFFGSPVLVGDRLYCMSLEGKMYILRASRQYEEPTIIDLGEPSSATPAIASGIMYLRTQSEIMALDGR